MHNVRFIGKVRFEGVYTPGCKGSRGGQSPSPCTYPIAPGDLDSAQDQKNYTSAVCDVHTLVLRREPAAKHNTSLGSNSATRAAYAPLRCDVHNQDHLALELVKIIGLVAGQVSLELVEVRHGVVGRGS